VRPTLLDTNVLSEVMLPEPAPGVVAFVAAQSNLLISVAVFHELSYGVELLPIGARRARLSASVAVFRARFCERTIAISAEIAEISGRLRAVEKRSGFRLKPLDALIAASAISASARLATRNTKDFERLGIELVNPWPS
jgi:predicted nucleic acid-binding protein